MPFFEPVWYNRVLVNWPRAHSGVLQLTEASYLGPDSPRTSPRNETVKQCRRQMTVANSPVLWPSWTWCRISQALLSPSNRVNAVCDVAIHPPPSVYPKAGNGALRDQWAIKYHCQYDSPTIVFTVRDLVHWNYVTSENIPRMCKSYKPMLNYVFATYIFLFIRHSLHCNWLPVNCGVAANTGPPMN